MSKCYYLAGPMSGIPAFNFPLFFQAAQTLRAKGYQIVSPAELDDHEDASAAMASPDGNPDNRDHMGGKTWGDFLSRDVKLIAERVQGIIFLPNWQTSRGAKLEAFVALLHKDHDFFLYDPSTDELTSISREAVAWATFRGVST